MNTKTAFRRTLPAIGMAAALSLTLVGTAAGQTKLPPVNPRFLATSTLVAARQCIR